MSDTTLGQIITEPAERDAIHVAIAPVEAAEHLEPGAHVGLLTTGQASSVAEKLIGIVDPFLKRSVRAGEKFWLCLYQKTVTGMRHHWSHPAFKDEDSNTIKIPCGSPSEKWIREYAMGIGLDYNTLMDGAAEWIRSKEEPGSWGEYLVMGGLLEGVSTPDEFWVHYAAITGKKGEGNFFSCSC